MDKNKLTDYFIEMVLKEGLEGIALPQPERDAIYYLTKLKINFIKIKKNKCHVRLSFCDDKGEDLYILYEGLQYTGGTITLNDIKILHDIKLTAE